MGVPGPPPLSPPHHSRFLFLLGTPLRTVRRSEMFLLTRGGPGGGVVSGPRAGLECARVRGGGSAGTPPPPIPPLQVPLVAQPRLQDSHVGLIAPALVL